MDTAKAHHETLFSPMPRAVVSSLLADPNHCKCPRCWHYHSVKENHDQLCDRCCQVLVQEHPDHESVPQIEASLQRQREKYTAPN